jgi:uncharacterized protein (DUF2062 family)
MARKIFRWLHRRKLSRSHMRGGWLHGWFGDHLFSPHLWALEREGVSRALFWGCLICFSPLFGFQFVLGIAAAMFFRANIPVTLVVILLTNPATAVIYYPAAYLLGAKILGQPVMFHEHLMEVLKHGGFRERLEILEQIGFPLALGCTIVGLGTGFLGWALVRIFWRERPVPR